MGNKYSCSKCRRQIEGSLTCREHTEYPCVICGENTLQRKTTFASVSANTCINIVIAWHYKCSPACRSCLKTSYIAGYMTKRQEAPEPDVKKADLVIDPTGNVGIKLVCPSFGGCNRSRQLDMTKLEWIKNRGDEILVKRKLVRRGNGGNRGVPVVVPTYSNRGVPPPYPLSINTPPIERLYEDAPPPYIHDDAPPVYLHQDEPPSESQLSVQVAQEDESGLV